MRTHLQIGALPTAPSLDLGPEHPSRTGLVDLSLELVDGVVSSAEIQPGYLHRGAEKLFEVRDHRQVLMLADRHDWQAPFSGELGAVLTFEQLWGLAAPPRAVVLRTLLAEVARIHSHLGYLSFVPVHAGQVDLAAAVRAAREDTRRLMLALSGNRLHPMLNRLGGLSHDAPAGWLDHLPAWLERCARVARACDQVLSGPAFDAARGRGVLTTSQLHEYGVSGPPARAAGLQLDLRRSPGYLHYPHLDFEVPRPDDLAGDAVGRLRMLAHEVAESSSLVRQCRGHLAETDGPVGVKLTRIIKLPDAEARVATEAPWGIASYHLVSRGDRTPWRLALRTPTFAQVQALQVALVGTPLDQVGVVVASLAWTTGDLDK